jgi:hypothetical protein
VSHLYVVTSADSSSFTEECDCLAPTASGTRPTPTSPAGPRLRTSTAARRFRCVPVDLPNSVAEGGDSCGIGHHGCSSLPSSGGALRGPAGDGVDDLAGDGLVLIAATSVLATGLIQHFGFPEALQMTTDGVIGRDYCRIE